MRSRLIVDTYDLQPQSEYIADQVQSQVVGSPIRPGYASKAKVHTNQLIEIKLFTTGCIFRTLYPHTLTPTATQLTRRFHKAR